MNPAFSVIFFTTASGAGYGLLIVLGLYALAGALPRDFWFAFAAMALSLALITAGLLSSTAHLGHPERAWRAFSQWRSSWLSREGVMAVATYIPALLFGLAWIFPDTFALPLAPLGVLSAAFAFGTLFTTAMIYRSLKPIHRWHNKYVVPGYMVLGPMSGAVLALAVATLMGQRMPFLATISGVLLATGLLVKWLYWSFCDETASPSTPATATGLASPGRTVDVRSVEWPHTEENYILKEMGFRIGRKHAGRLRQISIWAGFLVPAVMIEVSIVAAPGLQPALTLGAALLMAVGVVAERWLFFAEARHTVMLYYGASQA
ncbi:MAG: DmsC/YnfH family molybdoenzyme membrane anchor subunit [Rhodospirillaceae bacterium]|nr:DmsC/YnfH family molybdoenzyme membrane anchor subunit [Rhodospirillaceae bacterium]